MAEATRHYLAGVSTNFVFDDRIFNIKSSDPAIKANRGQLWLIYDDIRKHKHEGRWRLGDREREIVVRAIMFLKSDREYQWPLVPAWYIAARPLVRLLTLGFGVRVLDRKFEFHDPSNVWPFRSHDEVQAAINEPKYLAAWHLTSGSSRTR